MNNDLGQKDKLLKIEQESKKIKKAFKSRNSKQINSTEICKVIPKNQMSISILTENKKTINCNELVELKTLANEASDDSLFIKIGYIYQFCPEVRNYEKAFSWFNKAAEQENSEAQFNLASMYFNGLGVEKNLEKAFEWIRKAALNNNIYAKSILSTIPLSSLCDNCSKTRLLTKDDFYQLEVNYKESVNDLINPKSKNVELHKNEIKNLQECSKPYNGQKVIVVKSEEEIPAGQNRVILEDNRVLIYVFHLKQYYCICGESSIRIF